jgi:hypothetical protein
MTRNNDPARLAGMREDVVLATVAFRPPFAMQPGNDLGSIDFEGCHGCNAHIFAQNRVYQESWTSGKRPTDQH